MNKNDFKWLCGFIAMESEDTYRHSEQERKKLKKILKDLREVLK